jgi:hypothetical protein
MSGLINSGWWKMNAESGNGTRDLYSNLREWDPRQPLTRLCTNNELSQRWARDDRKWRMRRFAQTNRPEMSGQVCTILIFDLFASVIWIFSRKAPWKISIGLFDLYNCRSWFSRSKLHFNVSDSVLAMCANSKLNIYEWMVGEMVDAPVFAP